jgi:hypothetical protein
VKAARKKWEEVRKRAKKSGVVTTHKRTAFRSIDDLTRRHPQ